MGSVGGGSSRKRLLLGALVSVGVIWFMFLATSMNRHQTKKTVVLVPLNVISKHLKIVGMQRHALHSNSEMIFVSKRRVPNGPDPIHNRKKTLGEELYHFSYWSGKKIRRAVKYRQPPTQD